MYTIQWLQCSCLMFLCLAHLDLSRAQEEEHMAIIPAFHDRLNTSGSESSLLLQSQQFVLFVYHNAVVVYSQADFVNVGKDTLSQEFALPSTGHDENGDESGGRISSGILSVQLWMGGERVVPGVIQDRDQDWCTITSRIAPGGQPKVRAIFWAQTSLTDVDSLPGLDTLPIAAGKRAFMVDLSHASIWKGAIGSARITVVLKDAMTTQRDHFSAEPNTYDFQDSTMTWSFRNVEPTLIDNVVVSYIPAGRPTLPSDTMAKLSTYIVKDVYDTLLYYVKQTEHQ
jgi:hypothetical protein